MVRGGVLLSTVIMAQEGLGANERKKMLNGGPPILLDCGGTVGTVWLPVEMVSPLQDIDEGVAPNELPGGSSCKSQ